MNEDAMRNEEAPRNEDAPTPSAGRRYVADFLPADGGDADPAWLAEWIDDGRLVACPRCHFVHLPQRPFPPDAHQVRRHGPTAGACDVCAAVAAACDPDNWGTGWEDRLPGAGAALADERATRAATLYRLWIGATDGADALRMAAIAGGLHGLLKQTRTPPTGEAAG